jgi:hypothetical protein
LTIPRRTFKTATAPAEMPQDAPAEAAGESGETGAPDVTVAAEAPQDGPAELAGESAEAAAGEIAPTPLGRAQSDLAATDSELSALLSARAEALAADDDARTMDLDVEIAAKERLRTVQLDKVNLRQAEASQAEARERAARHEAEIVAVEALIAERTQLAGRLAKLVSLSDRAFVSLLAANRKIAAAWAWQPGSHDGGVLLGDGRVLLALRHELFRIGHRPAGTGGQLGHPDGPPFPGGSPELLQWTEMPEKSALPMTEKFEQASRAASQIMRVGRVIDAVPEQPAAPATSTVSSPAPISDAAPASPGVAPQAEAPVTEPLPSTSPFKATRNPKLAALLRKQLELSMQDGVDEAYAQVGREIAALS